MTTKEKLFEAAKIIFSEKGYWNTRVSDIVKKAGVAQGTFYLYFKSKEDIFREIVIQIKDSIVKVLTETQGNTFFEKIEKMNTQIVILLYENRAITEIFLYQLFSTHKELRNIYFQTVEFARKRLAELVSEGIKNKEIKKVNPENVANLLIGYKRMVFEDYILSKECPLKKVMELSREGLKIILDGIKRKV